MTIQRVAVIFDNTARPETTGVYCRRALGEMVEVEHFLPTEFEQLRRQRFDLYLAIDDGLHYRLPPDLGPSAWWVIDTHLDFDWAKKRAPEFDYVFAAQRDGAEKLRECGIASATWLPLACDPVLHGRQSVSPKYDVSFVGNAFPGIRQDLLEAIAKHFPNSFIGNRYFEEMAAVYSASKIVFNRSLKNDVNMRVFEGLASGSLLVTNDLAENGLNEQFREGQQFVAYRDQEELLDKLRFYLEHDEARERIAAAGHAEVLARHTYRHRMETLLQTIESRQTLQVAVPDVPRPATAAPERSSENPAVGAYFEYARPEVAALVPLNAKTILDIGCGAGRLGASLKTRQPCHVIGLELNAGAAELARTRLDEVRVANVEDDSCEFAPGSLDCVICADVLEHLRDPATVLKKIVRWLSATGTLVASIPNVQNHTIIGPLLDGNWTYESAGLLDETHLKFFTRREMEKLCFRSGLEISRLEQVPGPGYAEWVAQGKPAELRVGALSIRTEDGSAAEDFFAYQFLIQAKKQSPVVTTISAADSTPGLQQLAQLFPWPSERPDVAMPTQHLGWLGDGVESMLKRELSGGKKLVVELGAWLGLSTRHIADALPQGRVITIDHWEGSPEHHSKPQWRDMLPQLYDMFLTSCWEYRDRIQPIKRSTIEGLRQIAECGLQPELIFIDADHRYEAVLADLRESRRLFPQATLIGDDYDDPGTQRAVQEFARDQGLSIETAGEQWRAWKLVTGKSDSRFPDHVDAGLTSIVLVTHNELEYTRMCVDSLRRRTDEPYELIVVDNGSTDGTVAWLRNQPDVRLLENAQNRGFPAAVNQGLEIAQGEQILLLNNDTLLTTGWLRRLLAALKSDPQLGLVGPVSNRVAGYQQIDVGYRQLESLDGFAWEWGKRHHRDLQHVDRLIGFCLLFRRQVWEQIGGLDERFGIGCYEDDDYCRRAIAAGWRVAVARDAFVHHFGSRTFHGSGADLGKILKENGRKFDEKWNGRSTNPSDARATVITAPPATSLSSSSQSGTKRFVLDCDRGQGLRLKRIKLSGCLIVRDNENTIRPCLETLRPWVDELIVVDTGSKDRTPEIAREYGARLFQFPWIDDFSAARNESVKYARGEWIFWMDSDDTLPIECGRKLKELAYGKHRADVLGYVMQVHCPGPGDTGQHDVTVVDHVKLFRNRPDLRFEGRIHEQILPAIRRAGGEVAFTDVYVVHSGSDHTEKGKQGKLERDLRILHRELHEQPRHPFVLFNLGMTYADAKEYERAADYLRQSIAVAQPTESHLRKAYALLISSLAQLHREEVAWDACTEALSKFPDDKELLFRSALLHHHFGRLREAERTYLRVLQDAEGRHFSSVDQGLASFKTRQNLALVYQELDEQSKAEEQWRAIIAEVPHYQSGWHGLAELLLQAERFEEATALLAELERRPALSPVRIWLAARLAMLQGDHSEARRLLEQGVQRHPDDILLHEALGHVLFDHGSPEDAELALRALLDRWPDHPSALHNLGGLYLRRDHTVAAEELLRRSLELRPDSPVTRQLWEQARQQMAGVSV